MGDDPRFFGEIGYPPRPATWEIYDANGYERWTPGEYAAQRPPPDTSWARGATVGEDGGTAGGRWLLVFLLILLAATWILLFAWWTGAFDGPQAGYVPIPKGCN